MTLLPSSGSPSILDDILSTVGFASDTALQWRATVTQKPSASAAGASVGTRSTTAAPQQGGAGSVLASFGSNPAMNVLLIGAVVVVVVLIVRR